MIICHSRIGTILAVVISQIIHTPNVCAEIAWTAPMQTTNKDRIIYVKDGNSQANTTPPAYKQIRKNDHILGCENAPNIILHYSSLGCIQCFIWHSLYFAIVKKEYIDTCQAQYILREIPISHELLIASQHLSCSPNFFQAFHVLLTSQLQWIHTKNQESLINEIMLAKKIDRKDIMQCINSQRTKIAILEEIKYATSTMNVRIFPTFFVNGKRIEGNIAPSEIKKHFY